MAIDIQDTAMSILSMADEQGTEIRLLGGLAIKIHCNSHPELFDRPIPDIDFVGHYKDKRKIVKIIKDSDFQPAEMFNNLHPDRLLFYQNAIHIDVFLDVFDMCHKFDFRDRVGLDKPTLPPADLLATKLQIVELNNKDLGDMARLLCDHELSKSDSARDTVNESYIVGLCTNDWGIYRTFTGNIKHASNFVTDLPLKGDEKEPIQAKLAHISASMEASPKPLRWRMRAKIGDRQVWYRLPETRVLPQTK